MIPIPPPPRATIPPPPPSLPNGQFVKVVPDPNREGTYKIVSSFLGLIVGDRFDKGKASRYPDSRSSCLTLDEAKIAFSQWESFCAVNQVKK